MKVPFLDLQKINSNYHDKYLQAFAKVLDSGRYIMGEQVKSFESAFANYCGAKHCIGVGNGLDALNIALRALGIKAGDEVLVPANTFIATFLAISAVGAIPVPVDPDEKTLLLEVSGLDKYITENTKAIIAVHLFGLVCDMDAINSFASKHGLFVIEDAAQAHGAIYKEQRVGAMSHAAAFSFYPGKNMGGLGDGGAIVTNDSIVEHKARIIHNYGSSTKYIHEEKGLNSRLDEIQAAFLVERLIGLERENDKRREIADFYLANINNSNVRLPFVSSCSLPVWHLFVLRVSKRDDFISFLSCNDIDSLIHYPVACHKQECYPELHRHHCPVAESAAKQIVSIPISPVMTNAQVEYVVQTINDWKG